MRDIPHNGHPEDGPDPLWSREKAHAYPETAGFGEVSVHRLDHDIRNDHFVSRKAHRSDH